MTTTNEIAKLKVLAGLLLSKNALAAVSGRSCPVAVRVAARLETRLDLVEKGFVGAVESWIAEIV